MGKNTFQKNNQTGEIRTVTTGTSGTTPGGKVTPEFTSTQVNNGAVNAGVSVGDFKKLDPDVQNYYASSNAATLKASQAEFQAVQDGTKTADDVKAEIDSSNATDSVKQYLKDKVDIITPTKKNSWFDTAWNFITGK